MFVLFDIILMKYNIRKNIKTNILFYLTFSTEIYHQSHFIICTSYQSIDNRDIYKLMITEYT